MEQTQKDESDTGLSIDVRIGRLIKRRLADTDVFGLIELMSALTATQFAKRLGRDAAFAENLAPTFANNFDGTSLLIRLAEVANGMDEETLGRTIQQICVEVAESRTTTPVTNS